MALLDALRDVVWAKTNGACGICNQPVQREVMHIDHIVARARGGPDTFDNMQAAHPRCNMRKGMGENPAPLAPPPPLPVAAVGKPDLKIHEVAALLETGNETVRRWIRAGKIHGVSYGSDRAGWRVTAAEVERFKREGPAR